MLKRHRFKIAISSLLLGMVLSACSHKMPLETTKALSTKTSVNAVIPSQRKPTRAVWWQRFGDPQLVSLIQQALNANPGITTAQASIQSAKAQLAITGANFKPTVIATSSASHNSGNNNLSGGFNASWEADLYGQKHITQDAAQADLNSSYATLDDVSVSLAAEVAKAYITLRWNQASLRIYQQNLAKRGETLGLVKMKHNAGLASGLELDQAKLSAGKVKAQLPALKDSIKQSEHTLAILLGKKPNELNQVLGVIHPIPVTSIHLANSILANKIRQRPDIRAAEYQLNAASLRVKEAALDQYPSLSLSGNIGLSGVNLGDLLDAGNILRSIVSSVSAPIFNAGKLKQQVLIKESSYTKAQAHYQKTVLSALQDIANVFSKLQSIKLQKPILANNNKLANSTVTLAKKNYDVGLGDFQAVLDAEQTALNTQDSLLSAQAETSLELINLYKAIGGEW